MKFMCYVSWIRLQITTMNNRPCLTFSRTVIKTMGDVIFLSSPCQISSHCHRSNFHGSTQCFPNDFVTRDLWGTLSILFWILRLLFLKVTLTVVIYNFNSGVPSEFFFHLSLISFFFYLFSVVVYFILRIRISI